ncbi:MAG: hypothetical protein AB1439_03715 [candidate division FCPU426 bacterium]
MANVKGTGPLAVYEFLKQRFGEPGMQMLRSALSPEDQKTFDKPILPVTWVDFGFYMRMIVVADKVLGKGDMKIVEEAARYNMDKNFKGVYKILVSFVTPAFIIKRANIAWQQWFDSGKMLTEVPEPCHARATLTGFSNTPPNHEYNLTPSIDEIIRISGGKNTHTTHVQCVLKGAPACVWEIRWEE